MWPSHHSSSNPEAAASSRAPRTLLTLLLVQLALFGSLSFADYAEVNRRVSLRSQPTAGANVVRRAELGDNLRLLSNAQTNGFFHVSDRTGQSGWVYRSFVTIRPGDVPALSAGTANKPPLQIRIIDVGQGDAIYIRCPDGQHQMLIDAGDNRYPNSSLAFQAALIQFQAKDDPIEVVVSSHPHADHLGSMEWVLRTYKVKQYIESGTTAETAIFRDVERALSDRAVPRTRVSSAASTPTVTFCPLSDISAQILRPRHFGTLEDPNDNSVIVRVDYKQDSFLFVGDAEVEEEELLLHDPGTRAMLNVDFLKLGHHGSDTSSSEEFITAVSPDIVAVSCGAVGVSTNARYKHPRFSTIDRLLRTVKSQPGSTRVLPAYSAETKTWKDVQVRGALYVTSLEGDLLFESDGTGIVFRPAR